MGKKSRLKREIKEAREQGGLEKVNLNLGPHKKIVFIDSFQGKVYRFFKEKWQADALVQGSVFLSTLKRCRDYEDEEQGDAKEANETYHTGNKVVNSSDPHIVREAQRHGISLPPNIGLENIRFESEFSDAYILCTAAEYSSDLKKKFGPYCVEITDPRRFFKLLSKKINSLSPIWQAATGKVVYADRNYSEMDVPNGQIGFVKPEHPYAYQKEFRFIWRMQPEVELKAFPLKCLEIKSLCKLIP